VQSRLNRWRGRPAGLALVAVIVAAVATACRDTGVVAAIERGTIDLRFTLRGARPAPRRVVIVGLDENSLGQLPQFPFSRTIDAALIARLHRAGAAVIVYDFAFDRQTTQAADEALANAVAAAAPVVLVTTLIDHGQTEIFGGNSVVRSLGAYPAAALLPADPDGAVRHLAASVEGLPTVAAVVDRLVNHRALQARQIAATGGWIDFAGPPGAYRPIPFVNVLHGRFDAAQVRGKVVIVGPTASVLQDFHTTAVGGPMSGSEVQANAIATALAGLTLHNAEGWVSIALIIVTVLAVCGVALRLDAVWVAVIGLLLVASWCAVGVVAFDHGVVLSWTPQLLALVLATGGATGVVAIANGRERRRLRELFATAAPEVVAGVLADDGHTGLPATAIIAGYRVERLLASGGMGSVYEATQLDLGRRVALKLIRAEHARDPEYRARFEEECRAAAAVEHANVIPVYEAGEDDGLLFIAMRLVAGVDLGQVLARIGSLEPGRATRIIEQVASALDAAHARGLVHRDVKPANVLLTLEEPEHVYLTDFGIAKRVGASSGLTRADRLIGTVDYAAPEQIRGEEVDAGADVYALTALAFHCLSGHPPYPRASEAAAIWAHLNDRPPELLTVDPVLRGGVNAVFARGLAKRPDDRFVSCAELAAAIAGALGVPCRVSPVTGERSDTAGSTSGLETGRATEIV